MSGINTETKSPCDEYGHLSEEMENCYKMLEMEQAAYDEDYERSWDEAHSKNFFLVSAKDKSESDPYFVGECTSR